MNFDTFPKVEMVRAYIIRRVYSSYFYQKIELFIGIKIANCDPLCFIFKEPGNVSDITVTSNKNVLHVDWEPEQSTCLNKRYIIEYELLEFLHDCDPVDMTIKEVKTTSTSIDITVKHNAKYAVYIKTQLNETYTSERQSGGSIDTPGGKFVSF